eukprot:TRINITY_DN66224_c9_g2_i1.p1 TRINITY_DN66224_c9_g2~~TRINITY_DN66224_c9_g2_i1.p1  ORF type:complete len:297 (+),score=36.07 TRINITY_DN66224_c9_g2_i1:31-921(+)
MTGIGANSLYIGAAAPTFNSVGDPYEKKQEVDSKFKGPQMKAGPVKKSTGKNWATTKAAWDYKTRFLSEGDRYIDQKTIEQRAEKKRRDGIKGPAWKGTVPAKKKTGPGVDIGGTSFGGGYAHETEYPVEKRGEARQPVNTDVPVKNFLTAPAVKGTYGMRGLTIGKEGELTYITDPYDRKKEAEKERAKVHTDKMNGKKPWSSSSKPPKFFGGNGIFAPVAVFKKKEPKPVPKKEMPPWRPTAPKVPLPKIDYYDDPVDMLRDNEKAEKEACKPPGVWKPLTTVTKTGPFRKIGP